MDDNLQGKGSSASPVPYNKGKLIGQKPPLKREEIWAIRIRLQIEKKSETLPCSILQSTANYADVIS